MDTIYTILVAIGLFTVLIIWFATRSVFEKHRYKSLNVTLQQKLDIISAQNAELIAAEAEIRNQYTALTNFEREHITQDSIITALVEASVHGMLTVDSRMRIRHFNKHFCEMWDLSEDKIHVGRRCIPFYNIAWRKRSSLRCFS